MNNAHETPLRRFVTRLHLLYLQSLCCYLLQSVANAWHASWCCKTLTGLLSRAPRHSDSRLHHLAGKINARLEAASSGVTRTVQESIFCRIYRALYHAFQNSRLLGWLFAHGTTGVLLFLIGGYVVWDWLLRDIMAVPVFSSLWDEMLLAVSALWLVYQRTSKQCRLTVSDTPLDAPVLLFLAVCLALFVLQFRYPDINTAGLRATVQYILWFFVVTRLLRDDGDCIRLYSLMVLIASAIGLYGVYQYIVGAPMPAHWVDQSEASVRTRVYAIFSSCNIMGDFMVLFAPMAAGIAYAAKDKRIKLLAWACTLIMCLSCLLTMSRGAWIAMAVAILLFALLVDLRLLVLVGVAGCVALCLPFVQSRIGYLFTDAYEASANRGGRSIRWEKAIGYLFRYNPIWGMGFGIFGGAIAVQHPIRPQLDYFYTDNYYVKILCETGFTGLFSFIVMMLGVLWTGLKAWFRNQQKKSRMSPLCAGMLSGMAGVLVHCYFENIFEEPYMMAVFWIIAAMTMYLGFLRPDTEH